MLVALIDQCRNLAFRQIIQARTRERKTVRGEIGDRRGEVEFAVEPRFYGVPVGGDRVGKVIDRERAHMTRDNLEAPELRPITASQDRTLFALLLITNRP